MPFRRVFADAFVIHEELEQPASNPKTLRYRFHVGDKLWEMFYAPIAKALQFSVRHVGRTQTGNIRVYLGYSFFTLIFLLWVIS